MLTERTVIDQIEICQDGDVRIRFGVQIVKDGEVIDNKWHRATIPAGCNSDDILDIVENHLSLMGRPQFDRKEFKRVKRFCELNNEIQGIQNEGVQIAATGGEQG